MNDAALRKHVLHLLDGGSAHLDFEKAVAGQAGTQFRSCFKLASSNFVSIPVNAPAIFANSELDNANLV